jgi:hypothetical protein
MVSKPAKPRRTLSPAEVAAELSKRGESVSDRAVRYWVRSGCPADRPDRRILLDLDEVVAWRRRFASGSGHGGRRRGAGRRRKILPRPEREPESDAAAQGATGPKSSAGGGGGDERREAAQDRERQEDEETRRSIDREVAREKLLKLQDERLARRGALLVREDVERAVAAHLGAASRALEAIPTRAAAELVAILGVDPERTGEVRARLRELLAEVADSLATNPFPGGRP